MKTKAFRHSSMTVLTILLTIALSVSIQAGIGSGESQVGPVPVELTQFSASVKGDVVVLNWTTATEVNNYGFEIERLSVGQISNLSPTWKEIGFVEGHGNSNSPKEYIFVDIDISVAERSRSYRLKQIDTDGQFEYSPVIVLKSNLLKEYVLEQNYPNPFNPSTVLSYSIPKSSHVTLKVFDVLGNTIAILVSENQEVGSYKVTFDALNISNGIYFYKISASNFVSVKKMLLLK